MAQKKTVTTKKVQRKKATKKKLVNKIKETKKEVDKEIKKGIIHKIIDFLKNKRNQKKDQDYNILMTALEQYKESCKDGNFLVEARKTKQLMKKITEAYK